MGLDSYYRKSQYVDLEGDLSYYFRGNIYRMFIQDSTGHSIQKEWIDNDELIQIALKLSRFILGNKRDFKNYYPDKEERGYVKELVANMCSKALEGYGLYGSF